MPTNPQVQLSSDSPPPFRLANLPWREKDRLSRSHCLFEKISCCPAKRNLLLARVVLWREGHVSVSSCPDGMFVSVNSCSGEMEIPFCVSARARQCLAFSVFIALAGYCLPFPAKRNGGGLFVGLWRDENVANAGKPLEWWVR